MQDRSDAGLEECRKGGMQERREAGKEGFMKRGIQERREAGRRESVLEGYRKGGIWDCKCTDEILISYVNSAKNSLANITHLYFLVICV